MLLLKVFSDSLKYAVFTHNNDAVPRDPIFNVLPCTALHFVSIRYPMSDSETESENRIPLGCSVKKKPRISSRTIWEAQAATNKSVSKNISDLAALIGVVHSEGKQTSQRVDLVEVEVKKDSERLDKVEKDVVELNNKLIDDPCARSLRDQFISKLPELCDSHVSGICCWVPVGFENEDEVPQELIVISIQMMVWVYTKLGMDAAEVRSFFTSPSNFPRFSDKFQREEFLKIILKTPFRPYAVGRADKPYSMVKNEERFVFTTMKAFRSMLDECHERFPGTEKVVLKKSPERAGQMYAFGAGAPTSSPGLFSELGGLELTNEDKRLVPAMGVKWWKDLLTPTVLKFVGSGTEVKTFDDTAEGLVDVLKAKLRQKQKVKAAKNKRSRERKRLQIEE